MPLSLNSDWQSWSNGQTGGGGFNWSGLAGGVGSVLDGIFGLNSANEMGDTINAQMESLDQWRNILGQAGSDLFGLGRDRYGIEDQLIQLAMATNARRDDMAYDYMNYARDWQDQNRQQLLDERNYAQYRISQADKDNAAERARLLQNQLRNEQISAQERAFAEKQLAYAQEIARGERAYDVQRYEQDRSTKESERRQQQDYFNAMWGMLQGERDYAIRRQENVLNQAQGVSDELGALWDRLGTPVEARRLTEKDLLDKQNQLADQYIGDVDRAVTRIASINEAGLMGRGVDRSSTGDAYRKRVLTEQAAPMYQQARTKAQADALQYISGLANTLHGEEDQGFKYRAGLANEITGQLAPLTTMNQVASAPTATSYAYSQLPTGILERNLVSANNYQAPVAMGTGVYNAQAVNPSINPAYLSMLQSAASTPYAQTPGYETNYWMPNYTGAGNLYSTGGQMLGTNVSATGQMLGDLMKGQAGGGGGGGGGLGSILSGVGSIASAFAAFSDARLKENITPVTGAVDKLLSLRGVEWDWKHDGTHGIGVVAQEVENALQEAVMQHPNGYLMVDYAQITALAIEAIRELRAAVAKHQEA